MGLTYFGCRGLGPVMSHPRAENPADTYFPSAAALGPNDEIKKIDMNPTATAAASDSTRMCWWCEATIALLADAYVEVVIRYEHNYGFGSAWAHFCDAACLDAWATAPE